MPSLEQLKQMADIRQQGNMNFALGAQTIIKAKQDQDKRISEEKYNAAAARASEQYLAGDTNGAIGTMMAVDKDLTNNLLQQLGTAYDPKLQGQIAGSKEDMKLGAQTKYDANPRQMLDAQIDAGRFDKAAGAGDTTAQKTVDKVFGKTYEEWITGKAAQADRDIQTLEGVVERLGKTDKASGPLIGWLPEGARDVLAPESREIQQDLETVISRTLKETLGGQFAQLEAQQLLSRAFNPSLSEAVNKRRAKITLGELKAAVADKAAAVDFYEKTGSLNGFKSRVPKTAKEFLSNLDQKLGPLPGSIVNIKGKQYRVGSDGDSLEEVK